LLNASAWAPLPRRKLSHHLANDIGLGTTGDPSAAPHARLVLSLPDVNRHLGHDGLAMLSRVDCPADSATAGSRKRTTRRRPVSRPATGTAAWYASSSTSMTDAPRARARTAGRADRRLQPSHSRVCGIPVPATSRVPRLAVPHPLRGRGSSASPAPTIPLMRLFQNSARASSTPAPPRRPLASAIAPSCPNAGLAPPPLYRSQLWHGWQRIATAFSATAFALPSPRSPKRRPNA